MLQSCPTLCDPIDQPTSSSVHGILQARILENLLKPASLMSPTLAGRFFTTSVTQKATNVGDVGSISASGRSPGEGDGNPLQYSCLENPMNRGAWWTILHGTVEESDRTSQLNNNMYLYTRRVYIPLGNGSSRQKREISTSVLNYVKIFMYYS